MVCFNQVCIEEEEVGRKTMTVNAMVINIIMMNSRRVHNFNL